MQGMKRQAKNRALVLARHCRWSLRPARISSTTSLTGKGRGLLRQIWAEFLKAAELVRAMLEISPDAWRDAVETMGQADASIVVAAILQKGDEVHFPGGYLRALTEKKRERQFSVGPILMALIGTKLKAMRGGKGIKLI